MANIFCEQGSSTCYNISSTNRKANMHGLETINRMNAENFLQGAEKLRSEGRYVLVSYDGVNVTGLESFSSSDEAFTALHAAKTTAGPSNSFTMLLPAHDDTPAQDLSVDAYGAEATETSEEERDLVALANARDEAEAALCAAAQKYAVAQAQCMVRAALLRKREQDKHVQGQLFN